MSAKRYLATFYRGRRLYVPVLLLLLAATVLGTYFLASTQYEATARIWVDEPALANVLDPNASPDYLYLVSPAQQQADKLAQLIQTDSFVVAVLTNTTASASLTGDAAQDRVIKDVRGKLTVAPFGSNTVKITFAGSDPALCQQVVQSTIDQFRARDLTARVEQSAIERQFYQKQLEIYEGQADAAATRVEDFQRDHPFPDPSSPQYLELQGLQRELESARALLNATRTKIEQANAAASLSDTSRQVEFQVLDAPTVPTRPAATPVRLATYLALGVIASFGFILLAVAIATWQDTTIRTGDDLQRLTRVPLLDAIPRLPSEPAGSGERQHPAAAASAPKQSTGQDDRPQEPRAKAGRKSVRTPKKPAGQLDESATVYPSTITE
jgi:uncharacterized protein involved in exopolysaccharide biosynthesis